VRSGQSSVYSGITGGHRAIVLRLHGREGLHTCQAVSLGVAHEPGRWPRAWATLVSGKARQIAAEYSGEVYDVSLFLALLGSVPRKSMSSPLFSLHHTFP
jgi:hypothetical protein